MSGPMRLHVRARGSLAESMRHGVNQSVLTAYRVFSIITLYAVLAGVVAFAASLAFYATSTSWVAPLILSKVDKDTLEFTSRLVTTRATLENLTFDVSRLERQVTEAMQHRSALEALGPGLDAAIRGEHHHQRQTGENLATLT